MAKPTNEGDDFEFISIHVRSPRTHLVRGWPVYSDYEIVVKTNSMIFAKEASHVRRRFSEFVWLWKQLSRHSSLELALPTLPTKSRIFGRFNKGFIEERRNCLQEALASLTRITPVLADSAFHLFIQSNLSVKEMENFMSGQDRRDLLDIIAPPDAAEQQYRGSKDRRCTCHSTGDSGFSGSVQPDDINETARIFDDVSNWVTSQQNYVSSVMGNGWSSGYTCHVMRKSRSNSHLPACPECSDEQSTTSKRRISLSHNVASVLPGGQLMVAPTDRISPKNRTSPAGEKTNGDCSEGSKPYEADDETELDLSDFDIIKEEPFVRVREWLNSQNEQSRKGADSSDEEEHTAGDCPRDIRMKDYDVISVPCTTKPTNSASSKSIGYHSECEMEGSREEEDKDSEFTVVHSSIGGLDWKDRDELSSSCDSLHSAALFLTYDVVEMIELRYNNVV